MSVIDGMLYKIVPFLVWYHLQDAARGPAARVPRVNAIIDPVHAMRQWRWHLAALLLLAAAPLARPAGLFAGVALGLLLCDLSGAPRLYRQLREARAVGCGDLQAREAERAAAPQPTHGQPSASIARTSDTGSP